MIITIPKKGEWKELIVYFISTIDQLADIITEGLAPHHFSLLRDKLMVPPEPINLRGAVAPIGIHDNDDPVKR